MRRFLINFTFSMVVGAAFIWLAIRDMKLDWQAMAQTLRDVRWDMMILFFLSLVVVHVFRVWRWDYLLRPLGKVPLAKLNAVASVGFMAVIVLPLRLGEFVRPYLIAEKGKIRMTSALATIVVERVTDGLMVALLLFVCLFSLRESGIPTWVSDTSYVVLTIFFSSMVVLVLAYWKREPTLRFIDRVGSFFSRRLALRMVGILSAFIDGLKVLPDWRNLLGFLITSAIYWAINGVGYLLLFYAFNLDLSSLAAFTVMSLVVVGILIPGGPGHVGNFEFFAMAGLGLFLADQDLEVTGTAYILLCHSFQFVQQVLFGVIFLLFSSVPFRRVVEASHQVAESVDRMGQQDLAKGVEASQGSSASSSVDEGPEPPLMSKAAGTGGQP